MNHAFSRTRPEGCISDLRLDQLLVGELDAAVEQAARAHLAGCAGCAARLDRIQAGRAAFLAEVPPLRAASGRRGRAHRGASARRAAAFGAPLAAALAAAAAFALWIRTRPPDGDAGGATTGAAPDDGTRVKGRPRIGFYRKHRNRVSQGAVGEVVHPGDTLQFTYTLQQEAAYFALVSVDGSHKASVYYPDGPRAARIARGTDVLLETSTVLDGVLGHETAYGLFCSEPIALEEVRAAFEASPRSPPAPAGCAVDRVSFVKKAAP